jgi:uncharacterized protein
MTEKLQNKYENLKEYLKSLEKAVIAFSGGVDSSLLLYIAHEALREKAIAVTVVTPYIAGWEVDEAKEFVKALKIRHEILKLDIPENIDKNPSNRCYLCKSTLFSNIIELASNIGYTNILEGTNHNDLSDYRPGLKALKELNIISPFVLHGIAKDEIREISRALRLPTWDKPAYACLLTRIPYDTKIQHDDLRKIEQSELFLKKLGYNGARVRIHNDLARIEVSPEQRVGILSHSNDIHSKFKEFGFNFITIDILGYRTGSFNETLSN